MVLRNVLLDRISAYRSYYLPFYWQRSFAVVKSWLFAFSLPGHEICRLLCLEKSESCTMLLQILTFALAISDLANVIEIYSYNLLV